jgi:hypothetical protein
VVKPCKDFGSFVKGTIYVCNQTLCNISEYIKKPRCCASRLFLVGILEVRSNVNRIDEPDQVE